ncbi:MAG: CRISPR-associated endonuclease Cas2 [Synergistetes bacterium]|nr:CRISPR-associated endonuclease Cas2 [Synergistota bacterium]
MFYVISYDISDDKIRNKVSKILEGYGMRVQKSVFECWLDDRQFATVRNRLSSIIDMQTDSVRFYALHGRCVSFIEVIGNGYIYEGTETDIV